MKKYYVAILLAMTILLSMGLAGCDSGKTSATTAATNAAATTKTTVQPGATEPVETGYVFPWQGDTMTIKVMERPDVCVTDQADNIVNRAFKALLGNVEIEYLDIPDGENLQIMWSTGNLTADIICSYDPQGVTNSYSDTGALLDFSLYLDYMPNYVALADKYPYTYAGKLEDHIYALSVPPTMDLVYNGYAFNTYYLDQGLEIPTTLDELFDYMMDAKELNPDMLAPYLQAWQAGSGNNWSVYVRPIATICGGYSGIYYDIQVEQYVYGTYTSEFKVAVQFAADCYANGLIPLDFEVGYDTSRMNELIYSDNWAFTPREGGFFSETYYTEVEAENPGIGVEFTSYLLEDENQKTIFIQPALCEGDSQFFCVFANARTENPEFVCAFLDYLQSDEIGTVVNYGVEGVTYTVENGVNTFMPELKTALNPDGTVLPSQYGLIAHPAIKQLMVATQNDYYAFFQINATPEAFAVLQMNIDLLKENPNATTTKFGLPLPALTEDETERYTTALNAANTYETEQCNKFVLGTRDMSEWDTFLEELDNLSGIKAIVEIINSKEVPVTVNK